SSTNIETRSVSPPSSWRRRRFWSSRQKRGAFWSIGIPCRRSMWRGRSGHWRRSRRASSKSYEVAQRKQERIQQRQGHDHMPALNLTLKPKDRSAVPRKAKNRHRARDRQPDHDRRDDRRQDQESNATVDRQ